MTMRNGSMIGAMAQAALLGAALSGAATAAPQAATAPLMPTGKWTVEYADNMCVLSRDYGPAEARMVVAFRPLPLGDSMEVVVLGGDARGPTREGKARIQLMPSGDSFDGLYVSWQPAKEPRRATRVFFPQSKFSAVPKATGMTLEIGDAAPLAITLTTMPAASAALTTCQDDLLRTWGVDPEENRRIVKPAEGNPASWFDTNDYPLEAVRAQQQGSVVAMWQVGLDGRVRGCRVIRSSRSAPLDAATCAVIVRKGRYTPAIGADGKPMPSYRTVRIDWKLPSG